MGMKFNADVKMMGVEHGQYEGKPWWKVGLMQGIESKVFYLDQEDYDKLYDVEPGADLIIKVEINSKDGKTYFKLVDYTLLQPVKVKDKKAV